jgi:hypothetical protein
METIDLMAQDRIGEYFSITYMVANGRVWFVSYFDHKPYSLVEDFHIQRLSEVA